MSLMFPVRLLAVEILGVKWLLKHVPQVAFEWMIVVVPVIAGLRMVFW